MRKFLVIFVCGVLSGCMTVQGSLDPTDGIEEEAGGMMRRFISLRQVYEGMTRQEVQGVLSSTVVVGYELADAEGQWYKPVTVANPYRQENISAKGKTYQVDYYLFGIKTQDGKISDEELVPFVFCNGKMTGHGWTYFYKKIRPKSQG